MARMQLGREARHARRRSSSGRQERGYDKPVALQRRGAGLAAKFTRHDLLREVGAHVRVRFRPRRRRPRHRREIRTRMWPSLALALPVFVVGLAGLHHLRPRSRRSSAPPTSISGAWCCASPLMSISSMFYIIGGQYLVSKLLAPRADLGLQRRLRRLRGSWSCPSAIGVIGGIGGATRVVPHVSSWRRSPRTTCAPRARRASPRPSCMFRHVLQNAMIPILTGVVVGDPARCSWAASCRSRSSASRAWAATRSTPSQSQDFAIVRSMVFLGSVLYIVGLLLTDISYTLVDPRVQVRVDAVQDRSSSGPMRWSCCWSCAIGLFAWYVRAARASRGAVAQGRRRARAAWPALVGALRSSSSSGCSIRCISGRASPGRTRAPRRPIRVEVQSVLDVAAASRLRRDARTTYSAPLRARSSTPRKRWNCPTARQVRDYPAAASTAARISKNPRRDCARRRRAAQRWRALAAGVVWLARARRRCVGALVARRSGADDRRGAGARSGAARREVPWRRDADHCWPCLLAVAGIAVALGAQYHVFGTDKVGQDVLYQALKSIRTGARDRHADDPGRCCPSRSRSASWPAISAAGSTTSSSTSTRRSNSIPGRAADRRRGADDAGLHRYPSRDCSRPPRERADVRLLFLCLILGVTTLDRACAACCAARR